MMWMALQWEAWARGHTSAIGRLLGLYCVYEDGQYSDHLQVASTAQVSIKTPFLGLTLQIGATPLDPLAPPPSSLQIALCSTIEAVFLGSTLLIGGTLCSLLRILMMPSSADPRARRSFGQAAVGLYTVQVGGGGG